MLDRYGATLVVKNGAPSLDLPKMVYDRYGQPTCRSAVLDLLIPHLKHNREGLLEWCRLSNPDERDKDRKSATARAVQVEQTERARIIRELQDRARLNSRDLVFIDPFPKLAVREDGLNGVPDTARWACVAGDGKELRDAAGKPIERTFAQGGGDAQWTELPNPTSYEAAERRAKALRAKKAAKRKKRKAKPAPTHS